MYNREFVSPRKYKNGSKKAKRKNAGKSFFFGNCNFLVINKLKKRIIPDNNNLKKIIVIG